MLFGLISKTFIVHQWSSAIHIIYLFTIVVIPTERSEWRYLFIDVSTTLDMTGALRST